MNAHSISRLTGLVLIGLSFHSNVNLVAQNDECCHDGGDCNHCHQQRRPYFHRDVFPQQYYSDFGPSSGLYDPYTDRRNYYDPLRVRYFDTENGYYSNPTPDERTPSAFYQ